ncbi:MAG TPA: Pr6Pr family membrane protein [Agromyces sp.]|nr:Pr6Pr family membrane protein [Agromyces sp.]
MPARGSGDALGVLQVRRSLGVFRLLVAVLEIVAIIGNYQYVLGFRFFATANFFSYFTIQSAMMAVVVLLVAGAFALLTPRDPAWLGVVRTIVTVYVLVSGIVFGLIVAQASTRDYRVDVPWSDTLLHFVVPGLAIIAWVTDSVTAVNVRVPWSTVGWVLVYPSLWLAYTLVRGADVGWYPYFFLDEAQVDGPVGVALYCALVLLIFLMLTAALVALNRLLWRRARAREARPSETPDRQEPRVAEPARQR